MNLHRMSSIKVLAKLDGWINRQTYNSWLAGQPARQIQLMALIHMLLIWTKKYYCLTFLNTEPDLFESLLQQDGVQQGIQLLCHILQQAGVAKLQAVFQRPHIVGVRELDNLQFIDLLHVFDPLVGLTLRVNHQWPAVGVFHNDSVVNGVAAHTRSRLIPVCRVGS